MTFHKTTGISSPRYRRTFAAKQFAGLLFIISVLACPVVATNLIPRDAVSATAQYLTITGVAAALVTAAIAIEIEHYYTVREHRSAGPRTAITAARIILWAIAAATATLATAMLAILSNWTLR
jgi:hypothetical protein